MDQYVSNVTLAEIATALRGAERVTLVTHAKPDGDAFGSVVALAEGLALLGKAVTPVLVPPVPASFHAMRGSERCLRYHEGDAWPESDVVVVLDTGAWAQVGPMAGAIRARLERTIVIDHHLNGDIAAARRYVDAHAAACAEIVAQLLDELAPGSGLFSPTVCDALFAGIASDTGWFRFSNTRPFTHELAARLQRLGVDHAELYRKLEQTERPQKLALMVRAMDSLRMLAGGRAALMVLRASDFADTGALMEETERLVDLPQVVEDVELVVLVTEPPGGAASPAGKPGKPAAIRVSFRSKPGPTAVNVSELARKFGGGGHARASGAKIDAPLDEVLQRISDAIAAVYHTPA